MKKIILATLLLLSGCISRSTPTQFYMLAEPSLVVSEQKSSYKTLGILPVILANYLRQPQIVTQDSETEYLSADFERWLEPLANNISANLSLVLSSKINTVTFPWISNKPEILLSLDVQRFHCNTMRMDCQLIAKWRITHNKEMLAGEMVNYTSDLPKADYVSVVQVMSDLIDKMSQEIAERIDNL